MNEEIRKSAEIREDELENVSGGVTGEIDDANENRLGYEIALCKGPTPILGSAAADSV